MVDKHSQRDFRSFEIVGERPRPRARSGFRDYLFPAIAASALVAVLGFVFAAMLAPQPPRAATEPAPAPPHAADVVKAPALMPTPRYPAQAPGEVYRWKDAQGRQHFGDRPPPGVAVEAIPLQRLQPSRMEPLTAGEVRMLTAADQQRQARAAADSAYRQAEAEQQWTQVAVASECDWIGREIERIDARMRAGYREPLGERLRDRRRDLKDRHYALGCLRR